MPCQASHLLSSIRLYVLRRCLLTVKPLSGLDQGGGAGHGRRKGPGVPFLLDPLHCRVLGENEGMRVEVECYSGRKADERPVRFRLDGHEYIVEEVLDQWDGPEQVFFKVRADDGKVYILRTRPQRLTVTGILFPSGGPADQCATELKFAPR
jgi:hypothetical protein